MKLKTNKSDTIWTEITDRYYKTHKVLEVVETCVEEKIVYE